MNRSRSRPSQPKALSAGSAEPIDPANFPSDADPSSDAATAELDRYVIAAIDRLSAVVVQETAALRSNRLGDFKDFNTRKSHGLLELDRALRRFGGRTLSALTADRLRGLRRDLDINRATLTLHLDAVREIAAMLTSVIRTAESDGTYSRAMQTAS